MNLISKIAPLFVAIGALAFWEVFVRIGDVAVFILPPPSLIFSKFIQNWPVFLDELQASLFATVKGFIAGGLLGFLLAVILMAYESAQRSVMPLLVFFETMPKVAIAPVVMIWFGLGDISKVILAAMIVFFAVMINTMSGLKIAPEYSDLGRVYGAGRWRIMRLIRIPNSLPNLFTGLRIGATLAVIGVTVAEFVGAQGGLGQLIIVYQQTLQVPEMFVAIFLLATYGYLFFALVELIEKYALPWHKTK